jgi:uncharacterized protein with PIN domain
MKTHICPICQREFLEKYSEKEVDEKLKRDFGSHQKMEDAERVCIDCYKKVVESFLNN